MILSASLVSYESRSETFLIRLEWDNNDLTRFFQEIATRVDRIFSDNPPEKASFPNLCRSLVAYKVKARIIDVVHRLNIYAIIRKALP